MITRGFTTNSPDPRRWPSENFGSLTGAAAEAVIRGEEAGKREADAYTFQGDFENLLRGVVNSEREKMPQQHDTPRLTAVIDESKSEEREKELDALLTNGAKSLANELHLHKQIDSQGRRSALQSCLAERSPGHALPIPRHAARLAVHEPSRASDQHARHRQTDLRAVLNGRQPLISMKVRLLRSSRGCPVPVGDDQPFSPAGEP